MRTGRHFFVLLPVLLIPAAVSAQQAVPDVLLQDQAQVDMNLVKPTAYGTQFRLGSQTGPQ